MEVEENSLKIMTEAVGCLTAATTIKLIKKAGFISVGTDSNADCFARNLADEFYQVPLASDPGSADFLFNLVIDKKVDLVMPTLDDGLIKWAQMSPELEKEGVIVALSPIKTIETFQDKWTTYLFFKENNIPTPETSLTQQYDLVKPRNGRGGMGVKITKEKVNMDGMISQQLLIGDEYTVDVFCDIESNPVYIVPRKRIHVIDGKSSAGIVVENPEIERYVKKICSAIPFVGMINMQCFVCENGEVVFTEINPRKGGGTVLGMAATENWIPLAVKTFVEKKKITDKKPISYGLKMGRFYDEVFYF